MPADDKKRRLHQALVDRLLGESGQATPEQRCRAFDNVGLSDPGRLLVDSVATRPWSVTGQDLVAVETAGLSGDEIFELVVCAAVGAATRQYQAGLTALNVAEEGSR